MARTRVITTMIKMDFKNGNAATMDDLQEFLNLCDEAKVTRNGVAISMDWQQLALVATITNGPDTTPQDAR